MNTIFRLKFAYKYESESGEIKKGKTEVFAECENYTDAEKMVASIAAVNQWDRFGAYDYEIIRTKFPTGDFIDHKTLEYEDGGNMINGLIEHYFSEDNDGFFVVKAKFIDEDDNGKPKSTTQAFVVSDHSINQAINTLKDYLNGHTISEVVITDSKLDPADSIYLTPATHNKILNADEA